MDDAGNYSDLYDVHLMHAEDLEILNTGFPGNYTCNACQCFVFIPHVTLKPLSKVYSVHSTQSHV